MNTETRFKVFHRPTNEWFWFDMTWGYTLCVPLGEERKLSLLDGNLVKVDLEEADIYPLEPKAIVVYKDGSWKSVDENSSWEYENDADWLTTIKEQNPERSVATGSEESSQR